VKNENKAFQGIDFLYFNRQNCEIVSFKVCLSIGYNFGSERNFTSFSV